MHPAIDNILTTTKAFTQPPFDNMDDAINRSSLLDAQQWIAEAFAMTNKTDIQRLKYAWDEYYKNVINTQLDMLHKHNGFANQLFLHCFHALQPNATINDVRNFFTDDQASSHEPTHTDLQTTPRRPGGWINRIFSTILTLFMPSETPQHAPPQQLEMQTIVANDADQTPWVSAENAPTIESFGEEYFNLDGLFTNTRQDNNPPTLATYHLNKLVTDTFNSKKNILPLLLLFFSQPDTKEFFLTDNSNNSLVNNTLKEIAEKPNQSLANLDKPGDRNAVFSIFYDELQLPWGIHVNKNADKSTIIINTAKQLSPDNLVTFLNDIHYPINSTDQDKTTSVFSNNTVDITALFEALNEEQRQAALDFFQQQALWSSILYHTQQIDCFSHLSSEQCIQVLDSLKSDESHNLFDNLSASDLLDTLFACVKDQPEKQQTIFAYFSKHDLWQPTAYANGYGKLQFLKHLSTEQITIVLTYLNNKNSTDNNSSLEKITNGYYFSFATLFRELIPEQRSTVFEFFKDNNLLANVFNQTKDQFAIIQYLTPQQITEPLTALYADKTKWEAVITTPPNGIINLFSSMKSQEQRDAGIAFINTHKLWPDVITKDYQLVIFNNFDNSTTTAALNTLTNSHELLSSLRKRIESSYQFITNVDPNNFSEVLSIDNIQTCLDTLESCNDITEDQAAILLTAFNEIETFWGKTSVADMLTQLEQEEARKQLLNVVYNMREKWQQLVFMRLPQLFSQLKDCQPLLEEILQFFTEKNIWQHINDASKLAILHHLNDENRDTVFKAINTELFWKNINSKKQIVHAIQCFPREEQGKVLTTSIQDVRDYIYVLHNFQWLFHILDILTDEEKNTIFAQLLEAIDKQTDKVGEVFKLPSQLNQLLKRLNAKNRENVFNHLNTINDFWTTHANIKLLRQLHAVLEHLTCEQQVIVCEALTTNPEVIKAIIDNALFNVSCAQAIPEKMLPSLHRLLNVIKERNVYYFREIQRSDNFSMLNFPASMPDTNNPQRFYAATAGEAEVEVEEENNTAPHTPSTIYSRQA